MLTEDQKVATALRLLGLDSAGAQPERYQIVVIDRGFVYVGVTRVEDNWLVIRDARCIRRWGTERGLGELATGGPRQETALDKTGTVRAPLSSVVHLIDTEAAKWA